MKAMLDRKIQFLSDGLEYQKKHNNNLLMSFGDYNCASTGNFHAKELFRQLHFIDLVEEPTWENVTLGHFFISKALLESGISIRHR